MEGSIGPNSWGRQHYDGDVRIVDYDRQIDVKNFKVKDSFIKAWVKKNLDGIKFKKRKLVG